ERGSGGVAGEMRVNVRDSVALHHPRKLHDLREEDQNSEEIARAAPGGTQRIPQRAKVLARLTAQVMPVRGEKTRREHWLEVRRLDQRHRLRMHRRRALALKRVERDLHALPLNRDDLIQDE